MKVTSVIAVIVGTFAALASVSCASQPVIERNSIASDQKDELQPRDTSSCKASARIRNHQHRIKSKKKDTAKKVVVKPNTKSHRKTSSKWPTRTRKPAFQTPKIVAHTSQSRTVSSTRSSAESASTGTADSNLSNFETTMLEIHNMDRAKHSASPLTWDTTLASAAAKWASDCKWGHTPNNAYGQNIAAGTASGFGAKDATDLWYDEISQYDFTKAQYSAATGHFTQMVWKGSNKLGCAIQKCSSEQIGLGGSGTAQYVVCNYDPPGNYIGKFKENVSPN